MVEVDCRGFRPPALLRNRHVQTLWPVLLETRRQGRLTHEVWSAPDGECLDLALLRHQPGAPGVLLLHGLEGSMRSPYASRWMAMLEREGWNGAVLHFRSCGPSPLRGSRLYHSGWTEDLDFVVPRLGERWAGLALAGVSVGGNSVLRWLGTTRGLRSHVRCAVGISIPYDLQACGLALDAAGFWPKVYREHLLGKLRKKAAELAPQLSVGVSRRSIGALRTFRQFDEAITAPMFGFRDALEYRVTCSSANHVEGVEVPTLLISALDDPLVPEGSIPRERLLANPNIELLLSRHGGHVGFMNGLPFAAHCFWERESLRFLRASLRR